MVKIVDYDTGYTFASIDIPALWDANMITINEIRSLLGCAPRRIGKVRLPKMKHQNYDKWFCFGKFLLKMFFAIVWKHELTPTAIMGRKDIYLKIREKLRNTRCSKRDIGYGDISPRQCTRLIEWNYIIYGLEQEGLTYDELQAFYEHIDQMQFYCCYHKKAGWTEAPNQSWLPQLLREEPSPDAVHPDNYQPVDITRSIEEQQASIRVITQGQHIVRMRAASIVHAGDILRMNPDGRLEVVSDPTDRPIGVALEHGEFGDHVQIAVSNMPIRTQTYSQEEVELELCILMDQLRVLIYDYRRNIHIDSLRSIIHQFILRELRTSNLQLEMIEPYADPLRDCLSYIISFWHPAFHHRIQTQLTIPRYVFEDFNR